MPQIPSQDSIDYVMCVRKISGGEFKATVGATTLLNVPAQAIPAPEHGCTNPAQKKAWYDNLVASASWKTADGQARGDLLIYVHGYNNTIAEVIGRHRRLKADLRALGFKGEVMSFDWPSGGNVLAYLEDRDDAQDSARRLVTEGIWQLAARQKPECAVNIHVLGHSTGAYVIREAFKNANDRTMPSTAWMISQILLIAGDISSDSMRDGDRESAPTYAHCVRLTNYFNRNDAVLDLSNVKRAGLAPRVGRVGLPAAAPSNAVNVNCSDYYQSLCSKPGVAAADGPAGFAPGTASSHSWWFGNQTFTKDLFSAIIGVDRYSMQTREVRDGQIYLKQAPI